MRFYGLGVTVIFCFATAAVLPSGATPVAGYTPVSDISNILALGKALEDVVAALGAKPRNWTAALEAYDKPVGDMSLRSILPAVSDGRVLLKAAVSYRGSADFVHEFVHPALIGTGKFNLEEKLREELALKGIVLQGLLMASVTAMHDAVTSCAAGFTGDQNGAPHDVDVAWGLYACSTDSGPIKLAEKRAPQYAVLSDVASDAGVSRVNARLLGIFQELQGSAQAGNCTRMQQLVPKAISQMQVPIIQGLFREAYETDSTQAKEHHGADGFVEVAEGWAFASAVLPAIDICSKKAAAIVVKNMDTLALGPEGPRIPDGYKALKRAVESTYECLGISCVDVNAMVSPWKTDQTLWEPCDDANLPPLP